MNVSSGDLAYIRDIEWPENPNNGSPVKVLDHFGLIAGLPAWKVESNRLLMVVESTKMSTIGVCLDQDLVKISGPSIKIDTETYEPIKELV